MPHSVAQLNAAVCNKSKAAFRLPTVREDHKEEKRAKRGVVSYLSVGLQDKITYKTPDSPL
jgi:hypothetical protein